MLLLYFKKQSDAEFEYQSIHNVLFQDRVFYEDLSYLCILSISYTGNQSSPTLVNNHYYWISFGYMLINSKYRETSLKLQHLKEYAIVSHLTFSDS